ncbi:hypothetical protein PF007_g31886 [Phytophthora fragariae]|nr:hypothetical protein PF007_g31886 [Phytophthora fragariae]
MSGTCFLSLPCCALLRRTMPRTVRPSVLVLPWAVRQSTRGIRSRCRRFPRT